MAINIISKPAEFNSGYNPIKYKINSTNKNKPGFRYLVELFDSSSNKIAEYFIAPDQLDSNYGDIDISRIIQNKLDATFTTTNFNTLDAIDCYFGYTIKFGESYLVDWAFDDYIFLPGGSLGFTTDGFSNVTHNYQVGDEIRVQLDVPYNNNFDSLNTYFEVTEIVSNKTIRTNGSFDMVGSSPSPYGGKITFADNSKLISKDLANHSATSINTAMDLKEYVATGGDLSGYQIDGGTNSTQLLTNQPLIYKITPEQFVFFNTMDNPGTSRMFFKNDNGDIFRKLISIGNVRSLGVGAGNLGSLSLISGTAPLIKSDTKSYEVYVLDNLDKPVSKTYKFILDKRCVINDTQIMFMDRKGSFNSFAFQLKRKENVSTSKKTYNQYIDNATTTSSGETVYYSEAEKTINLVTNFMGEVSNMYFEELMTSRHTYVLWEGVWYACIVNDTSFENEFERNNKMINKSISARFAVNNPIN